MKTLLLFIAFITFNVLAASYCMGEYGKDHQTLSLVCFYINAGCAVFNTVMAILTVKLSK
jgi:hypothetical protein